MTQPPTIDTHEATRALVKAGLDQPVAEEIVRVIDSAVQGGAVSRSEFDSIKSMIAKSEIRIAGYLLTICLLTAFMWGIALNFEKFLDVLSRFQTL